MEQKEEIIRAYFKKGWKYEEIRTALYVRHDIFLTLRQLKYILAKNHLRRRPTNEDVEDVPEFIFDQLNKSGQQHGYRFMYKLCQQAGFTVSRNFVYEIMKELDPEGLKLRKRKRLIRRRYYGVGPNFVWHIDAYDKLTPYGISVSGCIDGYSRYIIWMEASYTASDPELIAGYYLERVTKFQGCPQQVRIDQGTENGVIASLQRILRNDNDPNPVIIGKSTSNQRIESLWCQYRKENAEYYITMFHSFDANGSFSGDELDKELIRFCFLKIVQEDLNTFTSLWNDHYIRKSHNEQAVYGQPSLLYEVPEAEGADDCLCPVDEEDLTTCSDLVKSKDMCPCRDEDLFDLILEEMASEDLEAPTNSMEAMDLYLKLRLNIRRLLELD